jgi:hypothetical protein
VQRLYPGDGAPWLGSAIHSARSAMGAAPAELHSQIGAFAADGNLRRFFSARSSPWHRHFQIMFLTSSDRRLAFNSLASDFFNVAVK